MAVGDDIDVGLRLISRGGGSDVIAHEHEVGLGACSGGSEVEPQLSAQRPVSAWLGAASHIRAQSEERPVAGGGDAAAGLRLRLRGGGSDAIEHEHEVGVGACSGGSAEEREAARALVEQARRRAGEVPTPPVTPQRRRALHLFSGKKGRTDGLAAKLVARDCGLT